MTARVIQSAFSSASSNHVAMKTRALRPNDIPAVQEIERAAGAAFRGIGMPEIADDEPLSAQQLTAYVDTGLAWATVGEEDEPVAYLVAERVDGDLYLEQVSVHPAYAHRGLGRALIDHAAAHAAPHGLSALTLATFTDVPWNAPYYLRCGFVRLPDDELGPGLRAVREREAEHGLDRWSRTCMRRPL